MATTTPTPKVQIDWAKVIPVFELFSNVALVALGANGIVPGNTAALAATIEGGLNPLIANIKQGRAVESDVVIALSGLITTINVLKANKSLDPAVLNRLDEYGRAAQAGLTGYLSGAQGYDPNAIGQVQTIG